MKRHSFINSFLIHLFALQVLPSSEFYSMRNAYIEVYITIYTDALNMNILFGTYTEFKVWLYVHIKWGIAFIYIFISVQIDIEVL